MSDDADALLNKAADAIRSLGEFNPANLAGPWIEQERQREFISRLESEIEDLRSSWDNDNDDSSEYADDYEPADGFVDVTDEEMAEAAGDRGSCIVVVGNPVDGLSLVGPFSSFNTANEYGDLLKDTWFCAKLEVPSDFNPAWTDEDPPHEAIDFGELL